MTFARTFEEAKARHKPMKRGKPLQSHSRMKKHRVTPEQTAWRDGVLKRAGTRCQWVDPKTGKRCRVTGAANLDAHHINERSQRPDLVLDLNNGAALCSGPGRHHDTMHHTSQGRADGKAQGLLGGTTYELAMKEKRVR